MTEEEIQKNSEHWYNKYKDAEKRIVDLEQENTELKDKLDNWVKCAELRLANWQKYEKENKLLGERCNQLLKDKGDLTDELQELKEILAQTVENNEVAYETLKLHDQEEIGMLNSKVTELENKIADIKANCDLAIEGRDIKIKELEQQIEKLLDFVVERTEECDVCPLSETCSNSEGVCPYRNKRINLKEWILRHIEGGTVQTETKQFLEYDKIPNCLGTQTSGN